jgi:Possible lysine decarboxylase
VNEQVHEGSDKRANRSKFAFIGLVYGGGNVGLMGVLSDGVLRAGGDAVGVIPENLTAREGGHDGLTKLHVVRSMHERKALMADLSDAFIALPGGFEANQWTPTDVGATASSNKEQSSCWATPRCLGLTRWRKPGK